ncbi:MAG: hypothetical protein HQK65_13975, partial [Desulfamplus sp.]|nr:hypothetical protein [Desulfamplus sp.]
MSEKKNKTESISPEKSDNPTTLNISHYFLFILISGSFFICYKMMQGYMDPVIIAIILAV